MLDTSVVRKNYYLQARQAMPDHACSKSARSSSFPPKQRDRASEGASIELARYRAVPSHVSPSRHLNSFRDASPDNHEEVEAALCSHIFGPVSAVRHIKQTPSIEDPRPM